VLRRALTEARQRDLRRGNIDDLVPSIKVSYEPRENWLDARNGGRLLDALKPGRRLWAALAMLAGLRLSEIERLEWSHVDLTAMRLRAPGKKTPSAWRVIPISPDLGKMLTAAKKRSTSARVVARWPNVRRDLAAAIARINRDDAATATKRGRKPPQPLKAVTPNDLRRTFASWLKQQGRDSFTVAKLLGHTSSKMVELVYGRLNDETYVSAIASLPRLKLVSNG